MFPRARNIFRGMKMLMHAHLTWDFRVAELHVFVYQDKIIDFEMSMEKILRSKMFINHSFTDRLFISRSYQGCRGTISVWQWESSGSTLRMPIFCLIPLSTICSDVDLKVKSIPLFGFRALMMSFGWIGSTQPLTMLHKQDSRSAKDQSNLTVRLFPP